MIPEGWERVSLGDIAQVTGGKRLPKGRTLETDPTPHPYIRVSDMRMGNLDISEIQYLPADLGPTLKRYRVNAGDLLISVAGTLGVICRVPTSLHGANLTENADRISNFKCDPKFLFHSLMDERLQKAIQSSKTTNAQPKLALDRIRSFTILLPPRTEQRPIAEALETWDRAIETVEALIANARAQKQALMQQLLSGKRRLPGFSDPWAWADFADVFGRVKTKNAEGNTNVLTISAQHGLISQVEYFNKSVASDDVRGYTLLQRGDFAYNKSYSDGYPMGAIKPLDRYDSGIVSSLYICFRLAKRGFDHDFFRHYFEAGLFNREISAIAQEGARNHGLLNVSVVEFFETSLHIPQPDEQVAIAKVINAAEAEEQAYQAQLTALRQEKAALMQQLLTGKRRIKLPERESA